MGNKNSKESNKNNVVLSLDETENKPIKSNINNTDNILVKIPIDSTTWEKLYDPKEFLSQIIIDFKRENSIPENTELELIYENKILKIENNSKIESLINNNIKEIILHHRIAFSTPIDDTSFLYAKPFFAPFELVIFNKKNKNFKTYNYDEETIQEKLLHKCNKSSSYCNGNNYLFISGGVDSKNKTIGIFWEINLENYEVKENSSQMPKIKNHSMIYISANNSQKVYLVGGEENDTYYYDVNTKGISSYSKLNKQRIEPALIRNKNYLYCFDTIADFKKDFSLERINFLSNEASWELISPKISQNLTAENIFCQKFYGVAEEKGGDTIIFLGGIYENYDSIKDKNKIKNFRYNINENLLEKSDVVYKDFFLKEKTFFPFNNRADFILPDFDKLHQKIVFYLKEKNQVEIINYRHKTTKNDENDFDKKANNINLQGKLNLFKIDYNMPGVNEKNQTDDEFRENVKKNFFPDNQKKTDYKININIDPMKPDEKAKINIESSGRGDKSGSALVKETESVEKKDSNILIKEETPRKIVSNENNGIDTILDIKVNNEGSGVIKREESKVVNVKGSKNENDINLSNMAVMNSFSKFHSSCNDPNNYLDKKFIKNLDRNMEEPVDIPNKKAIKGIRHQLKL